MEFELIGDRILVQLDPLQDHTTTASGLVIPLNKVIETEGGRLTTELSKQKHLTQGTILKIGALAAKRLEEEMSPLSVGDRVYVSPQVVNGKHYEFPLDRTILTYDFEGHVAIPHSLIEAKIN